MHYLTLMRTTIWIASLNALIFSFLDADAMSNDVSSAMLNGHELKTSALSNKFPFVTLENTATDEFDFDGDSLLICEHPLQLTRYFREKFRIGPHRIRGDHGSIDIKPCPIGNREDFLKAIWREKCGRGEEGILNFWKNFSKMNAMFLVDNEGTVYLEVDSEFNEETHFYRELFEKLIIVRKGKVTEKMNYSVRFNREGIDYDDKNIQRELRNNVWLVKVFETGKINFFVYHKFCGALVTLRFRKDNFVEHCEDQHNIHAKRMELTFVKGVLGALTLVLGYIAVKPFLAAFLSSHRKNTEDSKRLFGKFQTGFRYLQGKLTRPKPPRWYEKPMTPIKHLFQIAFPML
ncbi:MAG: hypothetical protein LBB11_01300 [Puniceicoccales bacterium]|jgi:hypothetical protein|nr:hypothetical protein [Puniceicoccales bacterium]